MERKLKERITGAALLVVAGVVFIPWVLDGRVDPARAEHGLVIPPPGGAPSGVRTIVLNTDRETTAPTGMAAPSPATANVRDAAPPATIPVEVPARTVTADRGASTATAAPSSAGRAASPATSDNVSATPAPAPQTTIAATAPAPARTVTPDPTAGWAVQVGSFASEANARKLATQLVALDYRAFVSRKMLNGRPMYRVRVGPRATREEAAALAERLRTDRQPVRIVEHPG